MSSPLVLVLASTLTSTALALPTIRANNHRLVYIMLDGARNDYLDEPSAADLTSFTRLRTEGVRAKWVTPVFPALSLPAWTTLVTGLWPENHNVVANHFYDNQTKAKFALMDPNSTANPLWWSSEPLWTTATLQGRRAALYRWGRCDVAFGGVRVEACHHWGGEKDGPGAEMFLASVNSTLKSLDAGFDLIQVYASNLDDLGHQYGPDSEERREGLRGVDRGMRMLLDGIKERKLADTVNVVITSDHGMASSADDNGVVTLHDLDEFLPQDVKYESIACDTTFLIVKTNNTADVEKVFAGLSGMSGVDVYRRKDIPEQYHLAGSRYVYDIVAVTHPATAMTRSRLPGSLPPRWPGVPKTSRGNHGHAPGEPTMRGLFLATGPAFQKNQVIEPIDQVDIYQILTKVLGLKARPHNGTWAHVERAFVSSAVALVSPDPLKVSKPATVVAPSDATKAATSEGAKDAPTVLGVPVTSEAPGDVTIEVVRPGDAAEVDAGTGGDGADYFAPSQEPSGGVSWLAVGVCVGVVSAFVGVAVVAGKRYKTYHRYRAMV